MLQGRLYPKKQAQKCIMAWILELVQTAVLTLNSGMVRMTALLTDKGRRQSRRGMGLIE